MELSGICKSIWIFSVPLVDSCPSVDQELGYFLVPLTNRPLERVTQLIDVCIWVSSMLKQSLHHFQTVETDCMNEKSPKTVNF